MFGEKKPHNLKSFDLRYFIKKLCNSKCKFKNGFPEKSCILNRSNCYICFNKGDNTKETVSKYSKTGQN